MCGGKKMVFQNWNINHDASVLLSIRQAANSQRETAGEKNALRGYYLPITLGFCHPLGPLVIECYIEIIFFCETQHVQ